jgi:acyl carrier protein
MNISEKLDDIARDVLKLEPDVAITDDLQPGDIPDWDSLATIMILQSIESEYSITFDFDDIVTLNNWGELKELAQKKIEGERA